MSHYTIQTRYLVEQANYPNNTTLPMTQQIKNACPIIFNFDFPIWNENYRIELETKILRHYFNWELGLETIDLWKFYLETRLNEIMPYYNQLYLTTIKDYDYMVDVDWTEDSNSQLDTTENVDFTSQDSHNLSSTGTSSEKENIDVDNTRDETYNGTQDVTTNQKTSGNPTSHNAHSDFPQAPLETSDYATYEDYRQDVVDENVDGTGKTENESTNNIIDTTNTDRDLSGRTTQTLHEGKNYSSKNDVNKQDKNSGTVHRYGLNGGRSFTDLLQQYRDSLINIDMLIINELQDLFMSIY